MSVAILKADEEMGYWEYSVLTPDGEWNLEFSRGEVAGPSEHTQRSDLHFLHVSIKREGEKFFSSWDYKETPFLTEHELNPMIAASSIQGLAHWYGASATARNIINMRDRIKEVLGDMVESVDFIPLGDDMPDIRDGEDQPWLTDEDCTRIGPYADETYRLYQALFDYGMVITTPEWRLEFLGSENPRLAGWGFRDEHE